MTRLIQTLTSGMLLLSIPLVYAAEGDSKLKNVSITDVLNVPYRHSETTISYGSDQFQFGQLWLPTTSPARASLVLIHGGCRERRQLSVQARVISTGPIPTPPPINVY